MIGRPVPRTLLSDPMRLTLRNLLRFLDQTDLTSVERKRLQDLVDQSDRAAAWIERIRSLRSDAGKAPPGLHDEPSAIQVARYLDGSMSEQEIVAFEETMLASDRILAEVASVHLIGQRLETAEAPVIPVALRQSLYDIDRLHATSAENRSATDDSNVPTAMEDLPFVDVSDPDRAAGDPDPSPEAPLTEDDVRQPPVSLDSMTRRAAGRSWLVGGLLFLVLVGAFAVAYWLGQQSVRNERGAGNQAARETAGDSSSRSGDPGDAEATAAVSSGSSSGPESASSPKDVAPGSTRANDDSAAQSTADPAAGERPADAGAGATGSAQGASQPGFSQPATSGSATSGGGLPQRPDLTVPPVAKTGQVDFVGPRQPPRVVARSPQRQMLVLTRDSAARNWKPLGENAELREGDHVQVLSGTVARLQLGDQLTLFAVGPAAFSLGQHERASQTDRIELEYGRIEVRSDSSDVDWLLTAGGEEYRIVMLLAGASTRAQVRHYLPPGIDPRQIEPALIKSLHSIEGRCRIQSARQTRDLPTGHAVVTIESPIPQVARAPQTGLVASPVRPADDVLKLADVVKRHARSWQTPDREVLDELLDLKTDARQELRLAAMVWLAEQGNFNYVIDFMENTSNSSNWGVLVQALRRIIQERPGYAGRLYDALVPAGQEHQESMYGLILGFSPDDLEAGSDAALVDFLNHREFGIRVLAIENLRQITGGVTYGYLPTRPPSARERSVNRQWIPRLQTGGIRYAKPPRIPVPELSPAVPPDPAAGGGNQPSPEPEPGKGDGS